MAYCTKCGAELNEGQYFCPACGTPVGSDPAVAQEEVADSLDNGIAPGFSTRIDTDEFREAMGKGNKTFTIVMVATMLLLAPAVTAIAGLLSRAELPILIAAGVITEVIVLCVSIYLLLKRFRGKGWDGVVARKYVGRESTGSHHRTRPVHIVVFETDAGRKVKYKDRQIGHSVYTYLEVDDRVRYHPQLNIPFEKYDKSHDEQIICPFCGNLRPIEEDHCGACNKPLLK